MPPLCRRGLDLAATGPSRGGGNCAAPLQYRETMSLEAHRRPYFTLHAKLMNSLNRQSMLPGMEEAPPAIAARAKSRATAGEEPRTDRPLARVSASTTPDAPELAGKSVWVVDAHSLIFQVFH